MGTLNRIKLIVKSNVNDVLRKIENPGKTRGLAIEEMRENIRNVKLLITEAIADLKKLGREVESNSEKAKKWEQRALLALREERDDLAKQALERKQKLLEQEANYRAQIEQQKQNIESLKESLRSLEVKMKGLRVSPRTLTIDSTAVSAYDRMVEKVRDMEAWAEAMEELDEEGKLEREYQKLEIESKVEAELEKLKAKVIEE